MDKEFLKVLKQISNRLWWINGYRKVKYANDDERYF